MAALQEERAFGPREFWVARMVAPPFTTDRRTGREFHGGQIAASAGHGSEQEAIRAAYELIGKHRAEWNRGARMVIEPGFYSGRNMKLPEPNVWMR